jgi:Ca2+-binding RTX toxin-like protein
MLVGTAAAALLALPAMASANVTAEVNAGVLSVEAEAADAVTIICDANQIKVNGLDPAGNGACDVLTAIEVAGGDGANAITLTGVTTAAFPLVATSTIDGAAGNDTILGSEQIDRMSGGDGDDRIDGDDNPVGTRDEFSGGAGNDTLVWDPGEDDDTMDGGDGADTIEVNGGAGPEQFVVKPSTTAGRVLFDRINAPFNLDIGTSERLDLNMGGGDDSFTADAGLDALGFALDVAGDDGNDTIEGGDGADTLGGGAGNDTITPDDNPPNTRDIARGDAGDDVMTWNGGDDDDVNEGGDGSDTVTVNGAPLPEQFTIKPSATPGRATFDRLNTPPGPFNIDIATSERLDMNLNGGDDSFVADGALAALGLKMDVEGGDGNDVIDGSDADDLLDGGLGNDTITPDDNPAGTLDDARGGDGDDTIVWNGGDDDDLNEGGAGTDASVVNGAPVDERFTIKPTATAGRVRFDRLAAPGPGAFFVDIGTTEQLRLEANAGNDRIKGATGVAGRISTVLNAGDGNDRVTGTDAADVINGGKGHDSINSVDKAADAIDCAGGFDLALVDRRDGVRACEIVLGGRLRVALLGNAKIDGGKAAVRLRCVGTARCKGTAKLKRGGKSLGKARFDLARGQAKTVRIALNPRGRKAMSGGAKRMKLQIDSRDAAGNGWRTNARLKLR